MTTNKRISCWAGCGVAFVIASTLAGCGGNVTSASARDAGVFIDAAGMGADASQAEGGRPDGEGSTVRRDGSDGTVDSPPGAGATNSPPTQDAGVADTNRPVLRVMPLGDSITQGYAADDMSATRGGYRAPLFKLVHEAGRNIVFVGSLSSGPSTVDGVHFPAAHEGHGGYAITDITTAGNFRAGIAPLVNQALISQKPDIILLMIGTNDIIAYLEPDSASMRLAALLSQIETTSPNALILVSTILPSVGDNAKDDAFNRMETQNYNAAVLQIVADQKKSGKNVESVDSYAAFTADPTWQTKLGDGIHPTQAGYETLAGVWYSALLPHLE